MTLEEMCAELVRRSNAPIELLKEALASMEEEVNNRDGRDVHDLGCGNCEAGLPTRHSLGCRIRTAIRDAARDT